MLLTKDGQQEKIYWSNKYVEDLAKRLSVVNRIVPEKYKFYVDEAKFTAYLKSNLCTAS